MACTAILPAFLASALINGDQSGLSADDLKWLDAAFKYVGNGDVVSCSEETFFKWRNDLPGFELGCDCLEYTILYPEGSES